MRARSQHPPLREVLAFLCGALAALVVALFGLVVASNAWEHEEQEQQEPLVVVERPQKPIPAGTYMPLYLQTEVQWASIPYAGGTIADSGCGLVCAAMAVKYLTTQDVTPRDLAGVVGDSCLTDGVNDPEKFAQWIEATYPSYSIACTGKLYSLDEALAMVDSGALAFAGVRGAFGDAEYNSHVVMIWRHDDGGYWVRDPASAGNSARAFTLEELEQSNLFYFVCISGGNYGNARN